MKDISDYSIDISNFRRGGDIVVSKAEKLSCIYFLIDVQNNDKYVGKTPNKIELTDKDMIIFLREIHILTSQHPSILRLKGWSVLENHPTIVTYYMPNGSLFDCIKKSTKDRPFFTPTQKQIILYGISKGIEYLHNENIIDRDLKSSNILLDENFYPKICDFNLSKFTADIYSEEQSMKCYTNNYDAPEIHSMEGYNCKVDVYSFGRIMYELLTDQIIQNSSSIDLDNPKIPNEFVQLFLESQKDKADDRPDFNLISNFLSVNFLENVDKKQFQKYVNYINKESSKAKMIKLNEDYDLGTNYFQLGKPYTKLEDSLKRKNLMKISALFGNIHGQYEYAVLLLSENDMDNAIKYLEKPIEKNYCPALYLYYLLLTMKNQFLEAEDVLRQATNITDLFTFNEISQSIEYLCDVSLSKGNFIGAIKYLNFIMPLFEQSKSKIIPKMKEIADKTKNQNFQYEYAKNICQKNEEESIYYLTLAANQGHVEACFKMNDLLTKSELFSVKYKIKMKPDQKLIERKKYLELAANQKSSDAFVSLGLIYMNQKNLTDAKECFVKAIKIDKNQNAILNFALTLEKERLIEKEEIKKINLFKDEFEALKDLANAGYIPAKYHYSRLIREINDSTEFSDSQKIITFNKEDRSEETFLANLKYAFKNNYPQAMSDYPDFLKREADKGKAEMQYKYGKFLMKRMNSNSDYIEAIKYLKKAKNNHFQKAVLLLNNLYESSDNSLKLSPNNV